ncbi:unnamed protein product [Amaranthus hypochondriacus]
MAASRAAALSSKMSTSLRLHLFRQSIARSAPMASSAAISLTGTLAATDNTLAAIPSYDNLRNLGRVDWPAFHHQHIFLEAAARGRRKPDSDEDEKNDSDDDLADMDKKYSDTSDIEDFEDFEDFQDDEEFEDDD